MITRLSAKQRRTYREATARINICEGAVRSGKTVGLDFAWMKFVRDAPHGMDLLMIGKTERTLKRNVIDPIIQIVGKKMAKYVMGAGEFWLFGKRIYTVGANDESSEGKIRGMSLYGAYGDEMTIWPESFWKMLLSRLSEVGARFFGSTNPGTPTHWLKKQIDRAYWHESREGIITERPMPDIDSAEDERDPNNLLPWKVFSYKLEDNEYLMENNPSYIRNLKREYTGLWYRRFIMGEWVAAEGAIYQMFDPESHVVSQLPTIATVIADGHDYGSTNPTTGVTLALGVDGILYITREWAPPLGASDAELVTELGRWRQRRSRSPLSPGEGTEPLYTFVDPSAASLKRELKQRHYQRIWNAHNTPVVDGLRLTGALFDRGLLKVHRDCTHLIDEIGAYVWDDKAAERGKDEPVKENDHWVDAMRYAVYSSRGWWTTRIREKVLADADAAA